MNDYSDSGDTVLAGLVQHIITSASTSGLPTDTLLAASGLRADQLTNFNDRVPALCLERLVCASVEISKDPLIGLHMSEKADSAGFGVVGYIRQACSTLLEVIEMTIRYERLVSDIGHTSLSYQPGIALWCWEGKTDNALFKRHATEYMLGCWLSIQIRQIKNTDALIRAVYLKHAPPSQPELMAEYQRVYGCPVYFNQKVSGLVLSADNLKSPLAHPDPALQEVLEQHALQLIEKREQSSSFLEKARAQLRKLLHQGTASRELLAEALGMSSRHLHRQFEREEYSYRQLHDELRLELACRHLGETTESIDTVAIRLKFTESQSFIRWFRQHSGQTPGQYRRSVQPE
jgi:AraC-like DNA-binding protein